SRPGHLTRSVTRHDHAAEEVEKLTPKARATAVRQPIEASSPMVLNENDFRGRPKNPAAIFCATTLPSRMACCAVGGCDCPGFLISGTKAQSPAAQTSGRSQTCKNWFTTIRPRSFEQGSEEISGLGTVPAVHTRV